MGRRAKKVALDEAVRLAPNDWSSVEIQLLECSAQGFRAACDLRLRVGAPVTVEMPSLGWVRAHVTWCSGGEVAATFGEPIDVAKLGCLSLNREVVLARLLRERAAAHVAGKECEERDLRGAILRGLPVRTLDNPG
jgi:hypothetical protein